jgi:glycosyltransferase involved in cell wall biosynthesis
MERVFFTIITVCYDVETEIQRTLDSIASQTFRDFEHIIIDGDSKDKTMEIVNKNRSRFSKVISEPDEGVYDAMNKGINIASGRWIIFMNAGDKFVDDSVLEDVSQILIPSKADVVIGAVELKYVGGYERVVMPITDRAMWRQMTGCHQSTFYRCEALQNYRYSLKYRIAADYHLNFTMYKDGIKFEYINRVIACRYLGGLADKQRLRAQREKWLASLEVDGNHHVKKSFYFLCVYLDVWLREVVKSVLPQRLRNFIYLLKYQVL